LRESVLEWLALWIGMGYCKMFERRFTIKMAYRDYLLGHGQPAYIAHDDKVYDVSESKLWKTGSHMQRHQAGTDLTEDIGGAPHSIEVFEKFPQVGILKPEKDPMDEHIPDLLLAVFRKIPMLRRHPHPMTVHFPIAFMMLFPVHVVSRSQHPLSGDRKQEPGDKRVSCPGGRAGGRTGCHAYWAV
jgi:predicted heme/steroid binding protein